MADLIRSRMNENTLEIYLAGRIDSLNSAQLQKETEAACSEHSFDHLILDAGDLAYISSAGLRVILRLWRRFSDLKIVNVSRRVYDILETTGFTEMLPVERAMRCVSVDGCEVIGRGANGIVYRVDRDTIVKVYLNADALPDIRRERELARKAFILGIPTAISYDVVKVGDTYGSVFELLNADSFTEIISREPERTDEIVALYVELLKKIHSTEVQPEDMPDQKRIVLKWADDIREYLNPEKWRKLYSLIEAVPENHHMIHGDYHTKNVMMMDGEVILIDMDTLCFGDPVFEFASIFNSYAGFYEGRNVVPGLSFIGLTMEKSLEVYNKTLSMYFGTNDKTYLKTVNEKASLIGYTRLLRRTIRRCDMNDPEEKAAVQFYIRTIEYLLDRVDTLLL